MSEAYFRTAFESAAIGMALVDPEGHWLRANGSFCRIVGRSEEELRGLTFEDITHPDDRATSVEHVRRLLAGEIPCYTLEKRYLHRDGQIIWCLLTVSLVRGDDGAPRHLIAQIQDITERKRTESALRASEARYDHIAANVPGLVYQLVYRPDGSKGFAAVSEGARRLFGIAPEAALRDHTLLFDLVHPDDRPGFTSSGLAALAELAPWRWEGRAVLPTGEVKWVQMASRSERQPDGSILCDGLLMDITEQRSLQEQLRQAQKLEAVGRLAGGIAHDFNNLLTAILSHSELVLGELPDGPARQDAEVIRQTAERAAGLTRQLLAFSRKQVIQPRLIDVNAVVRETQRMLRRTLDDGLVLEMELGDVGTVLADPGQLEQVLVNLAVNARDAMPDGGTLTLRTRDLVVDEALARRHRGLQPGVYVTLAVEDTGAGIPPELQTRIFEPFFTTKPVGEGTGLGLATVYGLVKQWGGYTAVESAVGAGTTFTIYLRRQRGPAQPETEPAERLPTGTETVLVVEDEAAVRSSIRRILTRNGYTVIEARHGADALRVIDEATRPVDLVLTDLVMPELGGRELIAECRARSAASRVLAMSGYDKEAALRGEALALGTPFLEKPFTVAGLLRSVRAALDADPRSDRD